MGSWTYMPCGDCGSYYDYPDSCEFGNAEEDDAIFDQAWAEMIAGRCVAVRLSGQIDHESLDGMGALLTRSFLRDQAYLASIDPKAALRALVRMECQAIFPDNASAQIAALLFDGMVLR